MRSATLRFDPPSGDLFSQLREAIRRVGLPSEERFGVGAFVGALSGLTANPLNLSIREATKGSTSYLVRRVARLLPPGTFAELPTNSEEKWQAFKENPTCTTVYLPDGDAEQSDDSGVRFEVGKGRITRVTPTREHRRIIERRDVVERRFACISADHRFGPNYSPGWLTMRLDKPPEQISKDFGALSAKELAQWHDLYRRFGAKAKLGIDLPEWTDLAIERRCADFAAAPHLPAFLQAWKTMCILRSLQIDKTESKRTRLEAHFEDFAATGLLLRRVFREGSWFPSAAQLFNRISPVGERVSVMHPATGKRVVYEHREQQRQQWQSLV
jgi:hypothetical protein